MNLLKTIQQFLFPLLWRRPKSHGFKVDDPNLSDYKFSTKFPKYNHPEQWEGYVPLKEKIKKEVIKFNFL